MKHLKSYRIFESWIDEPKFFRFNREEMTEGEYAPGKRSMWGADNFNDCLVKFGFPDKRKCIHFMDSIAFNPEYKGLYGDHTYQITVDDYSNLGWSFVVPINEWFYKGNPFHYALRSGNKLLKSIMETPYKDLVVDTFSLDDNDNKELDEMAKYLIDFGVIGTGTIEDLKKSPHYGKESLFVWTTDKVIIKKYEIKKEPKIGTYKNQPVLTKDDFINLGIEPKNIPEFYQSEFGKKVKDLSIDIPFDIKREESLNLLKKWLGE
jgi:hypothetical protein